MHGLAPEYLCSRFQLNSSLPNYARTRGWNNIHLHRPNTNWYKKSFEFMGAKDWVNEPCKPSLTLHHTYVVLCMRSEQYAYYVILTLYCACVVSSDPEF